MKDVIPKCKRMTISQLVRTYVLNKNIEYPKVWGTLYNELYYRYGFNAKIRAGNRGIALIDAIDEGGEMENLYKIAVDLLK